MATATTRQRVRMDQDMWDRIWKDRHGNVVIWQRPNALLISWVVITLISFIFPPQGTVSAVLWWISVAVLAAWAVLEIWKGVNYFRRALGVVVILLLLVAAFKLA